MNIINKKRATACIFAVYAILLFATGCGDKQQQQQVTNTLSAPDTLWTPTGDAALDSLLQLAATSPQDTNLARLYDKIGDMYESNDFEKAKTYYLKIGELSEQLDWNKGRYLYAGCLSNMLNREGLIDSAIMVIQKALELAVRENDESNKANMLCNLGNSYYYKEWYEMALNYYMQALPFLERENNTRKLQITYYMMCQIYRDIGAIEKAIEYGEKSVAINRENLSALYVLATVYSVAHEYEKAMDYSQEVLHLCESQNNFYVMAMICYHLGDAAMMLFDLDKAEKYALQSMEIRRQYGIEDYCLTFMLLGKIEQLKGNYAKSEEYTKKALQLAEENENLEEKRFCFTILAELAVAQRKYRENVQYWKEQNLTEIAIAQETVLRASEEMSAKYETEKKELKISALEEEHRLMLYLGIAGGVVLLLVILMFFLFWRWTVQKKHLSDARIKQLEQERLLVAAQAVLDGENAERTRLARDLHDGLGSMLSLVKLNLPDMKSGGILEVEDVSRLQRAIAMLDSSISELRRVAHHIMPESLMRYGLKASLSDFCQSIPIVSFHYFGNDQRMDSKFEILIYRAAYELINNALKHAEATQINVQLVQESDRLSLTIYDNGKGFDTSIETKGMGLDNIRNRMETCDGKMTIYSTQGKGTEINIEIEF